MKTIDVTKRAIGVNFNEQNEAEILVWSPTAEQVAIVFDKEKIGLNKEEFGFWYIMTEKIKPGTKYKFLLNDKDQYPDPASLSQPNLVSLGIMAIETMPVAQFPGNRNWGYDGVFAFAVQNSYSGAEGLQYLVNASNQKGLAVILDVVYNHLGPEGNYLGAYGPYFTEKYKTPWGNVFN
jgi:maltooligosyltrehalose trehalohydrolase